MGAVKKEKKATGICEKSCQQIIVDEPFSTVGKAISNFNEVAANCKGKGKHCRCEGSCKDCNADAHIGTCKDCNMFR